MQGGKEEIKDEREEKAGRKDDREQKEERKDKKTDKWYNQKHLVMQRNQKTVYFQLNDAADKEDDTLDCFQGYSV